jgi:uncharacterized membrane protein YcfT
MPDFFLLSGLFLGAVIQRPWRSYLDTKVVHYLYFLVLWVALVHGYEWLARPDFAGRDDSAQRALRRYVYFLYQPDHMLWFIQTLPLYFVVTRLLNRMPRLGLVALAGIVTLMRPSTGIAPLDNFCQYYVYFVLGYIGAPHIFAYADLVAAHKRVVAGLLLAWVALNAYAVQAGWTTTAGGALVFGLLGIAAIVAGSRLLADVPGLGVLRYLGANSIVVYLGFFIPLHAITAAYAASGWAFNIHVVAAVIVVLSIAAPVLLFVATRNTWLRLLFARPAWAHLVAPRRVSVAQA